jgi:hypothetical protein
MRAIVFKVQRPQNSRTSGMAYFQLLLVGIRNAKAAQSINANWPSVHFF